MSSTITYTHQDFPDKALRKAKALIGALLRYSIRIAIITALISSISFNVSPYVFRSGSTWVEDVSFIIWLTLSTAFFMPGGILIDLGLCTVMAYQLRITWAFEEITAQFRSSPSTMDLYFLISCIEFATAIFIGGLRVLGLWLVLVETYYSAQISPSSRLKEYLNIILSSRYDWWTCKPVPEGFMSGAWYKPLYRPCLPILPQPSSPAVGSEVGMVTPYLSIFFGARTFQHRRGDRPWFVVIRGAVAVVCLVGLVAYSVNVLFLQPNDESGAPPVKVQRTPNLPTGSKMAPPTWGILVGINTRYVTPPPGTDIGSLISVTTGVQGVSKDLVPCLRTTLLSVNGHDTWGTYQFVSYQCAALWAEPAVDVPQIQIAMDYAKLNIFRSNFTLEKSVMIWPSFTSNIRSVLASTKPSSLMIGSSLIATVDGTIRVSFVAPTRATLGLSSKEEVYLVGQVTMLGADPFIAEAETAGSDGFASMRLLKAIRTTDWEMYSDTRHHSVLGGLSALGGLSSILNSAFIIIFGGSLMLVLFDTKRLSVFGLLHSFSKATLAQGLRDDYPQLWDEGGQPGQDNSGLVAFIREYMLDFSPLPPEAKQPGKKMGYQTAPGSVAGDDEGAGAAEQSGVLSDPLAPSQEHPNPPR